jgi:hypothetical protein
MSNLKPLGDYNLNPPEAPPECPNELKVDGEWIVCDCPLEDTGDSYICSECGWTPPEPDYSDWDM